jgi:hypothetical protein
MSRLLDADLRVTRHLVGERLATLGVGGERHGIEDGLTDAAVVGAFAVAVPAQHVELGLDLLRAVVRPGDQVARIAVARDQPQGLLLAGATDSAAQIRLTYGACSEHTCLPPVRDHVVQVTLP